jgi:hypothetical protein
VIASERDQNDVLSDPSGTRAKAINGGGAFFAYYMLIL